MRLSQFDKNTGKTSLFQHVIEARTVHGTHNSVCAIGLNLMNIPLQVHSFSACTKRGRK